MRSFFDTNVLVYAVDEDEPEKGARARDLLENEVARGAAVLSTQVLQEFYVTVTRKLRKPMPVDRAERAVKNLAILPVMHVDTRLVMAAIGRSRKSNVSLWDGLIIEAALASGAERLYTEDLQAGMEIDGLTIENPFA